MKLIINTICAICAVAICTMTVIASSITIQQIDYYSGFFVVIVLFCVIIVALTVFHTVETPIVYRGKDYYRIDFYVLRCGLTKKELSAAVLNKKIRAKESRKLKLYLCNDDVNRYIDNKRGKKP